jgi:hypothetical protein
VGEEARTLVGALPVGALPEEAVETKHTKDLRMQPAFPETLRAFPKEWHPETLRAFLQASLKRRKKTSSHL